MAVKLFVFFLPCRCIRFADDFSEIQGADEAHEVFARFLVDVELGLLGTQFLEEGCHAYDATYAGARVGFDVGVVLENFREVLDHALRDALVLRNAELGQISRTRGGVFVQVLGAFKQVLAQIGELACGIGFGQCIVKVVIVVGGLVEAAAVPAVVTQVEGLVPSGNLGVLGFRSGIGVVVAAQLAEVLGDIALDRIRLRKNPTHK